MLPVVATSRDFILRISKQIMIRNVSIIFFLFALLGLSSCQNYMVGSEARTVGEYTDDVGIAAILKARLLQNESIRGLQIDVDVNRGVVSLYGYVRTEIEKDAVLQLAASVRGVTSVEDRLVVVE
tara:strand:+ start:946 stop:1320 length:375 start_codon:yes stop_codon:yes gene_type:complete